MTSTLVLILRLAGATLWQLLPYVVLGVLASEALRYTSVSPLLERGCRRHPAVAIPLAAGLGMVSPLCTYGTVPLVLQLLRTGVPVAPLATFLSTSSLMNPQLLLITWGGLGPKIALACLAAVFAFGLLLGAILHFLPVRFSVHAEVREEHERPCKHRPPFSLKSFAKNGGKSLEFVGFYILLGVLLGAAIEVLVPGRWIMAAFGGGGWYQILLAALLGVPLYACGGGAIPLVRGLMEQGMAGGAVLAFLIAGPATRIPPLMALATIVRPLFIFAYVLLLIAYSVVAGLLYGLI
ncbi:MAG TPA: permease [Polyangia bacterium]